MVLASAERLAASGKMGGFCDFSAHNMLRIAVPTPQHSATQRYICLYVCVVLCKCINVCVCTLVDVEHVYTKREYTFNAVLVCVLCVEVHARTVNNVYCNDYVVCD